MSLLKYAFPSDILAPNLKLCSCPNGKLFPGDSLLDSWNPKEPGGDYLAPSTPVFMATVMLGSCIAFVILLYVFFIIKRLLSAYSMEYAVLDLEDKQVTEGQGLIPVPREGHH